MLADIARLAFDLAAVGACTGDVNKVSDRYTVKQALEHLKAIGRREHAARADFMADVNLSVAAVLDSKGQVIDSLKQLIKQLQTAATG